MCNGENERKKAWLNRYTAAKLAETELLEELQELEGRYIMPSKVMDDMPHSPNPKDLSGFAAQYDALYQKILKAYNRTVTVQKEILDAIDAMPTGEAAKTLLRYRYIRRKKWEEIACLMCYSYRRVTQLHGAALSKFEIPKA